MFWVYMLHCNDNTYYTGHTDCLQKRVAEHQAGTMDGYTAKRMPVKLIFSQSFSTRMEALQAEMTVKKWSKAKKEALIRGDWGELKKHAKKKFSN